MSCTMPQIEAQLVSRNSQILGNPYSSCIIEALVVAALEAAGKLKQNLDEPHL